ncbi:hypothetical protein FS837_004427 [Tulasnella sp. UAMH 9824]|nr:hypothetical protein FS837_004427 [Tulasnella sp. UAMH 9824]
MAKVPQINTSFHPDITMPEPDFSGLSSSSPEDGPATSSNLGTGKPSQFPGFTPRLPFTPASGFASNVAEPDYPSFPSPSDGAHHHHAQSPGLSPPAFSPNTPLNVRQARPRKGSDASVASAITPGVKPKASGILTRTETGLMHIDIPRKFGEAGEYWKRYDDISERADKDMVEMLNANLDILLIFSGLFSGVNTAFLCLSLVSLSPDNSEEMIRLLAIIAQGQPAPGSEISNSTSQNFAPVTQVVRVNCFWVASLTCSLLTSAGAMLGKQWVVYYTQDPPGTLEAQGRARQRRFNGAEKWRFRYIVEFLPMLIQASLLIFCIGLIDYFYALNAAVAWVILALTATGFLFYVCCLLAAIIDPDCPFRSLPSVVTRRVLVLIGRWNRRIRRRALRFYARHHRQLGFLHTAGHAIHDFADRIRGMSHAHVHRDLTELLEQEEEIDDGHDHGHAGSKLEDGTIDGQTACWMIETSEHETALLTAARNIPALHVVQGSRLDVRGLAFHRLLSLFRESLIVLAACNSPGWTTDHSKKALEAALIYGRAMGHVVVGSGVKKAFYGHFRGLQWPTDWKQYPHPHLGFHTNELVLLKYCLFGQIPKNFCSEHPKSTMPHSSSALSIYIAAVLEPSEEPGEKFRVAAAPIDRISLVQRLITGSFAAADPYATTLLSLNAWALGHLPDLVCGDKSHSNLNIRGRWWKAYTSDDNLYPNIIGALNVFHYYQRLVSAFHGHSYSQTHPHDHGHHKKDTPGELLAPAVWYSTYISLIRTARAVIDCGSRHQETLTKFSFKLDAALRRVDVVVAGLLETADGDKESDLLNKLRKEIEQLLQSIRIDGQQAMVKNPTPRSAASSTSSLLEALADNPHNLDDEGIYVVAPINLGQIADAMEKPEEDIRFAALSLCLDHLPDEGEYLSPNGSSGIDLNELTGPLSSYVNTDDSHPLLSMVLCRLIPKGSWRRGTGSLALVKAFQSKTRALLSKRSTFALLEASLNVWNECKAAGWQEVATEWETAEFAQLVETTMKRISHDQHAASHHGHDHTHDDTEEDHDAESHEKESTPHSHVRHLSFRKANDAPKIQPVKEVMNVPQPYIPHGLIAYANSEAIKNLDAFTTLQETFKTFVTLKNASWWVFHEK